MNEQLKGASLVVSHDMDEKIRFRLQEAEAIFGSFANAEAKSTNLPDSAPPEMPRLTLQGSKRKVLLGKSQTTIGLSFDGSGKSCDEAQSIALDSLNRAYDLLKQFHPQVAFRGFGAIFELAYPFQKVDDPSVIHKISAELAKIVYSGPSFGEVASLELKVGFKADWGGFKNIALAVYEVREGMLNASLPVQHIDAATLRLIESGVSLNLDVNDRPIRDSVTDEKKKLNLVLSEVSSFLKELDLRKSLRAMNY